MELKGPGYEQPSPNEPHYRRLKGNPCSSILLAGLTLAGVFSLGRQEIYTLYRSYSSEPQQRSPFSTTVLSRGKFLVAGKNIKDPRFAETVILLVDYSPDGAMGLIINRPTEVRLSAAFPEMEELKQRKDTIYIGGPVGVERMFLLIHSAGVAKESLRVFDDVSISSSEKVLRQMAAGNSVRKFRVYAGYAGWSPQQLDQEVMRGDWHVLNADSRTIFDKKSSDIWPELIQQTSKLWVQAGDKADFYLQRYRYDSSWSVPAFTGLHSFSRLKVS